jgi:hypothetical protein
MIGVTKSKRKVIKSEIETTVDSFLWRLANRRHSVGIALAILTGAFFLGAVTTVFVMGSNFP